MQRLRLSLLMVIVLVSVNEAQRRKPSTPGSSGDERGLFPPTLNLATGATISANATCGERGPEVYCKLVEHVFMREPQCGVCDGRSDDPKKRHPIAHAIDGTNSWWQSPTLQNGKDYEWVTVTLDLRQVYQVAYVIVKAANSPRPGNWILEKSLDGVEYTAWQLYASSDVECYETYGVRPTVGIPRYVSDDEVICTSYYSKLNPLENGEIHTSLVNGRPGVLGPSETLQEFTAARYVRLRLQRIRTLNADLMTLSSSDPLFIDKSVTRRYFYSIKDISIGGQCMCFGHARDCPEEPSSGRLKCRCSHNTCGDSCERCCPLYNQQPWRLGTMHDAGVCEKCQCFGHADECFYSAEVAARKESLNLLGLYEGGGVCKDCKHHTTGINCEQCEDGYFRPAGVSRDFDVPCSLCECDGEGAIGHCIKDDRLIDNGYNPGDCVCKEGFAGEKCDRCARGFRRYPRCEPCPCDVAGTMGSDCEGDCVCKENVEGPRCDRCKTGFFGLDEHNPEGCTACFCFGVADACESGDLVVGRVSSTRGWVVIDLDGKRVVRPIEEDKRYTIADDDMLGMDLYFWLAPEDFLGNKLHAYGTTFVYLVSWIKARGDSAGKHAHGPDIILEGDGMTIATGNATWVSSDNYTGRVRLVERGWFHVTSEKTDGAARLGSTLWAGDAVTRLDFTRVLLKMERLLLRAKYHTDQIEGSLVSVQMEVGSTLGSGIRKLKSVEKCRCPTGYAGLSCELCDEGYRRVNDTLYKGECRKCACNNHAVSCDSWTGQCEECRHHTEGDRCDRCLPGFYGNATQGTPFDCQPCACPLAEETNNFSPTCIGFELDDYFCDACPPGHAGNRCESCASGYFGHPLVPGNFCQPCDCSGNHDANISIICDQHTGKCLDCIGNTAGWRCNECRDGYHGDALAHDCKACECNLYGSLTDVCDKQSGLCSCKHNYVGQRCEQCAEGYGGVSEGCVPCDCDFDGAVSRWCHPVSGQCECKPGVFGAKCDSCLDGYYGFSVDGCAWCGCHIAGSWNSSCNAFSGQCPCKSFVEGRLCDRCQDGYWNVASGFGCEECNCSPVGSEETTCEQESGQCMCKVGVGGLTCDKCRPGYFGFSSTGCQKCAPCEAHGHLCHPQTGECVCPPNTEGNECERCKPFTWGYNPLEGCKPCECNMNGSLKMQCDAVFGRCSCAEGYEGFKCNKCRRGYFEFPSCKKCECHLVGTEPTHCSDSGICECDDEGQCPCRANVESKKCNRCRNGTFGMVASHPSGCFECFCFGKSQQCSQSPFVWSKIFIVGERKLSMHHGNLNVVVSNGLYIIPSHTEHFTVGIKQMLDNPLYWELGNEFLGDKVTSYNGYLSFVVHTEYGNHFSQPLFQAFPVVQLRGNFRLVLEHYVDTVPVDGRYNIKLHEDHWQVKNNHETSVTRAMMMVALQNIQRLLIRASVYTDFQNIQLHNVTMDVAIAVDAGNQSAAIGVELCECPVEYNGTSCQDPADGYYRKRKPNYLDSKDILELVGVAALCQCNGRSNTCDKETGYCLHCTENTTGPFCNLCSHGFYGDPAKGPCILCGCPTQNNSFSDTCMLDVFGGYVCTNCQSGYTGRHCEKCDRGYYGNPIDGECSSCNCDPRGSLGFECDPITGQCSCLEGITGKECSECAERFIITAMGCQPCNDSCVGFLLDEVQYLIHTLEVTDLTGISAAPWVHLFSIENKTAFLKELVDGYEGNLYLSKKLLDEFPSLDIEGQMEMLYINALKLAITTAQEIASNATDRKIASLRFAESLDSLLTEINNTFAAILQFGMGDSSTSLNLEMALEEAEKILLELLKNRMSTERRHDADEELREAMLLMERVRKLVLDGDQLATLQKRFIKVWGVLDKLRNLIDDIRLTLQRTATKQKEIDSDKHQLEERIGNITTITIDMIQLQDDCGELLNEATNNVQGTYTNLQDLQNLKDNLMNYTDILERRTGILERLNPEYEKEYVKFAVDHALRLMELSDEMNVSFSATREISAQPMKAVSIYENIVNAYVEAEEAAQIADIIALECLRNISASNEQSLLVQVNNSKDHSTNLQQNATYIMQEVIENLQDKMDSAKLQVSSTELANSVAEERLNDVKERLDKFNQAANSTQKLQQFNNDTRNLASQVLATSYRVDEIESRIESELRSKYDMYLAQTPEGVEKLAEQVDLSQKNLSTSKNNMYNYELRLDRLRKSIDQLNKSKESLKNKILLARQSASSITISLHDDDGVCVRSYKADVEPTTTSNIILNYAISTPQNDSLLFYMANSELHVGTMPDFMAVEMWNRQIRFIWNSGAGVSVIQHPRVIETNDEDLLPESKWYKIQVTRINNIANLMVLPTTENHDSENVTGHSSPSHLRMDLDPSSYFYIGGIPSQIMVPTEIKTRGFAGCLYDTVLDGKRIGLWNFLSNDGCKACKEGVTDEGVGANEMFFHGNGYFVSSQIRRYNPTQYRLTFSFKSFDENSLLFITSNSKEEQLMALELRNGSILFQIRMRRHTISIKTKKKYNIGEWIHVTAQIQNGNGMLQVKDEHDSFHEVKSLPSGVPSLFQLGNSDLYFGGVVSNFTKDVWPDVHFSSFLGCMKSLNIERLRIKSRHVFGVDAGCKYIPLKILQVKENGFLELNGKILQKNSSFAFSFQTSKEDGLLMLSTFIGKSRHSKKKDFYSVFLKDGKIHLWLDAGDGTLKIETPNVYNDCKFHTVSMLKSSRKLRTYMHFIRIELRVDDQSIDMNRMHRSQGSPIIDSPETGGLYFGGVPSTLPVRVNLLPVLTSFVGHIKDVVFNDQLLPFNDPVEFANVGIGRSDLPCSIPRPMEVQSTPTPLLTQCHTVYEPAVEHQAIKFGDNPNSYVEHSVNSPLKNKFNMTFEFRTYYPNGMLLFIPNGMKGGGNTRKKGFLLVLLHNGQIIVDSSKMQSQIKSQQEKLNDGQWHKVLLSKSGVKLGLKVDKVTRYGVVPKKLRLQNKIYIGGIPQQVRIPGNWSSESFKGCVNKFVVDEVLIDMAGLTHKGTIGQCFAKVEFGAYFGGDAYATYANDFSVGPRFEVALEFKTRSDQGVILSVSENGGSPSLGLEIYKGMVIMTVDTGDRQPFSANVSFPSPYSVCNNQWHSLTADYSKDVITLRVDNISSFGYGNQTRLPMNQARTSGSLYIGGLPDEATHGVLRSRANFFGCLRNYMLNEVRVDWTDMNQTKLILLNSCPVE